MSVIVYIVWFRCHEMCPRVCVVPPLFSGMYDMIRFPIFCDRGYCNKSAKSHPTFFFSCCYRTEEPLIHSSVFFPQGMHMFCPPLWACAVFKRVFQYTTQVFLCRGRCADVLPQEMLLPTPNPSFVCVIVFRREHPCFCSRVLTCNGDKKHKTCDGGKKTTTNSCEIL